MWTIDAPCSRCTHRRSPQHEPATPCADRAEIVRRLQETTNILNSEPLFVNSPGDGLLVVVCKDFAVA